MQCLCVIRQFLTSRISDLAAASADEISDGNAQPALAIEAAVVIDDTTFLAGCRP